MGGIAGVFSAEGPVNATVVGAVLRMLDAQIHRGPDDWGLLLPHAALEDRDVKALLESRGLDHVQTYPGAADAPAAVLGSRRLSIVDRSVHGRMPMGTSDQRVWVSGDGEIYNYCELRAELEGRGHVFRSRADTEAVVHGYAEWGAAVAERLVGMFAFAVLDARVIGSPGLFLCRDRFGIKPLYWTRRDCRLQFASEVRGLVAGGLVPNEAEPRGFHGFLVHGSVPAPWTTVRDVYAFPAAHGLRVDHRTYSFPTPVSYWRLPAIPALEAPQAAERVRTLLDEAVRQHLASDAPVGVCLSGGVDSAVITALAARHVSQPLTTLTVTFDEPGSSAGEHAARVARHHCTRHIEIPLRAGEFLDELPRVLAAMDQPSVGALETYFLAKAARAAGLAVTLSGAGADEVFGGPGALASLPDARRASTLLGRIAGAVGDRRMERLSVRGERPSVGLFPPRQAARLLDAGVLPLAGKARLTGARHGEMEPVFHRQEWLLPAVDVFGMAHGVEVRLPFLDHRLVEVVAALDERGKRRNPSDEPLLRAAMAADLDAGIVTGPRTGSTFPFQQWLRHAPAEIWGGPVDGAAVAASAVAGMRRAFGHGRIHWSRPWALSVLAGMRRHGMLAAWPSVRAPRRVLFLLSDLCSIKGGIQTYNQGMVRAVGEAFPRAELRVVSASDAALPAGSALASRVAFTGCGPRQAALRKPRLVIAAVREVICRRPDVLVCGHVNLAPLAWALRALGAPPSTLMAYGLEIWKPRPYLRWFARRARQVVAVSGYTATRVSQWGIRPARIRVIPGTVDGEVFRPLGKPKPGDSPVIFTVARLEHPDRAKGIDRMISALPTLRERFPSIRYVVGGEGQDVKRLRALASSLGVESLVEFLGHIPDDALPARLSAADVFVMVSRNEGFGIVFIEALACGVPVIAGGVEGSRDALLDGRLGLLVDPDAVGQLEDALTALVTGQASAELTDRAWLRSEVLRAFGGDRYRELTRAAFAAGVGG